MFSLTDVYSVILKSMIFQILHILEKPLKIEVKKQSTYPIFANPLSAYNSLRNDIFQTKKLY